MYLTLPHSAAQTVSSFYGFKIDGERHRFTLADLLEPGALEASRYLAMTPGMFGIVVGTDGWVFARYASRHPLGHMILELQSTPMAGENPSALPRRGPGRPPKELS